MGQDAFLGPLMTTPEHILNLALIESKTLANFALETFPTCGLHVHVAADMQLGAIVK